MQIVPQYIDVEDKIAGPLTWKHLGWFFGAGALLVLAFLIFDRITFYFIAFFIVLFAVALAFYKPNGVSLIEFLGYGFSFLFKPKVYTWQREVDNKKVAKKKQINSEISVKNERLTTDDIAALAQTLDSSGRERNEKIQSLINRQDNLNK